MEISEQVASIQMISMLVVNEFLFLDLPPPSRPLRSSQVRATTSCGKSGAESDLLRKFNGNSTSEISVKMR